VLSRDRKTQQESPNPQQNVLAPGSKRKVSAIETPAVETMPPSAEESSTYPRMLLEMFLAIESFNEIGF